MTIDQLQDIINQPPEKAVDLLKTKERDIPTWFDGLDKQYHAELHPIMSDLQRYPRKINQDTGVDTFRRIPLALQKLAVHKQAQALFYKPVCRKYDIGASEQIETAKDVFETNIRIYNAIDSTNIERAKQLFKCCEVATVWKLDATTPTTIKGNQSNSSLVHNIYSPALGYALYPYHNEKKLIGISIAWTAKEWSGDSYKSVDFVDTFLLGGIIHYAKRDDWVIDSIEQTGIDILPVSYISIDMPIWGGIEGNTLVEILEDLISKQQMYIDKNVVPTYVYYPGKMTTESNTEESDEDRRRIIQLGEDGYMNAVQWEGADEAVTAQYNRILEQFYQQIQIFDNRPSSMQAKAMSAENKEILLFDAKARATDIAGEFEKLFLNEFAIQKALTGIQFPGLRNSLDLLSARSVITPFSVRSKKETAEYIATNRASGVMSRETGIALLGEVDDDSQELDNIIAEGQIENNY